MSKTIEIDVTQADIDAGEPFSCVYCPISIASWRALDALVRTGTGTILADGGKRYPLPFVARAFVRDFDEGMPVAPFRFTVTVPDA